MKSLAPPPEAFAESQADPERLKEGSDLKEGDYKVLFQVDRPGFGNSYLVSHQVMDAEGNFLKKVAVLKRYHLVEPKDPDMPDSASRFMKYAKRLAKNRSPQYRSSARLFCRG